MLSAVSQPARLVHGGNCFVYIQAKVFGGQRGPRRVVFGMGFEPGLKLGYAVYGSDAVVTMGAG